MGMGEVEADAYRDWRQSVLYRPDAAARSVFASVASLRDWNINGVKARVYIDDTGGVQTYREGKREGKLWNVLLDEVRRPQDPAFFAVTEEQAILMWVDVTGLSVHPRRVRGVKKGMSDENI